MGVYRPNVASFGLHLLISHQYMLYVPTTLSCLAQSIYEKGNRANVVRGICWDTFFQGILTDSSNLAPKCDANGG